MGENQDISKIIGIIMENPDIIARIKGLAEGSDSKSAEAVAVPTAMPSDESHQAPEVASAKTRPEAKKRRRELLSALKPYVRDERAKAIDTMLSVIDVIDVMKER